MKNLIRVKSKIAGYDKYWHLFVANMALSRFN